MALTFILVIPMSKLTFKQKQAHYEKVSRSNYLASLRLAGFDTSPTNLNKPLISREQALEKYRESKTVEPDSRPSLSERLPMNLAPNFPDDHPMQQLMQLLHEEIGLPGRKTISLNTSINFVLGCNGVDAQHLIETLENHFSIDFVDFDSYRYFQPDGYDVFLKRKAKGRGDKEPLTIGMLYRAIKAQRWDTQVLEGL